MDGAARRPCPAAAAGTPCRCPSHAFIGDPMRRTPVAVAALAVLALTGTVACSSSSGGTSSKTITVAYQKFGSFIQLDAQMQKVKTEYQQAHPGYTVKLEPIEASENDY